MTPQQLDRAAKYKDGEREVRRAFALAWQASRHAVALANVFEQRVTSGDLSDMADLHAANLAPLGGADALLRQQYAAAVATTEAIQAAGQAHGLNPFPGVTVPQGE